MIAFLNNLIELPPLHLYFFIFFGGSLMTTILFLLGWTYGFGAGFKKAKEAYEVDWVRFYKEKS